jgi:hypothetical protein
MMFAIALLAVGCSAADRHAAKTVHKGKDSVISKVIEMLDKEKGKISDDIEAEGKEMAEYFGYCDDVQKETAYYIKEATRKIDDATAKIEDRTAQITALDEEVEELGTEMAERSEEMDKEVSIRKKTHEEFLEREKEQVVMVEELTSMEAALKEQMSAMTTPPPVPVEEEAGLVQEPADEEEETEVAPSEGHPTLVQLKRHGGHAQGKQFPKLTQSMLKAADLGKLKEMMTKIVGSLGKDPETQRNVDVVSGFIQQAEEPQNVEVSAEAMAGQQENTENNINAFEGLKKKAEEALQRERDMDVQKQHDHEMTMISLKEEQKLSQDKIDDCKRDLARLKEEKGEAEAVKATNEESRAEDEKNLKALTTECDNAASAWETRQTEATAEMAAIEKAKEILDTRVKVFIQKVTRDAPAKGSAQKIRQTLINHFRGMGQKLGSLSMLNLVSVASTQPLDKVKGLIKGMIEKLTKEAAEAASIHEFCKAEKAKNEDATKKATDKKNELQSTIDKASARKDQLQDTIAELTEEIAELAKSTEEAIKLRAEQHETFVKTEKDFSEAADAVQDAMDVLKDYYDSALLLQKNAVKTVKGASKAPPKLGGAKQDSAGGILSILDTMAGEFTKTVAEAQSAEKEQVKAFKDLKKRNFDSKSAKEVAVVKAENEIGSMDITLGHATEDQKLVIKELKAIDDYVLKLKPTCENRPMSYSERKAKRDAEIEGLKEALVVLEENTPTAFLQK